MEENYGRESDYLLAQEIQKKLSKTPKLTLPEDFIKDGF